MPRSLDSGYLDGGHSSLIKTDTFTYQNHDLEAIGSEGSFACRWLGRPMGSRKPKSRHMGGRPSSLIKSNTFNDQNHDLEASGSEGSFDRRQGAPLVSGQSRPAAGSFFVNTWLGVCGLV